MRRFARAGRVIAIFAFVAGSVVVVSRPAAALTAHNPIGRFDYAGVQHDLRGGPMSDMRILRGWTFDPDYPFPIPDQIRFVEDGKLQQHTPVFETRRDVARAYPQAPDDSGFYFRDFVNPGAHRYCIRVYDVDTAGRRTGRYVSLGCRTVTSPGQWFAHGAAGVQANFGRVGAAPAVCTEQNGGQTLVMARDGYLASGSPTSPNSWGLNRFGRPGDLPVCGDWNGDGTQTIGVYRPSTSTFYLTESGIPFHLAVAHTVQFGRAGDKPVVGDWDGDGTTDIGVWRPSNHTFYLASHFGAPVWVHSFGRSGDLPVAGDWDGDGRTDVGTDRQATFYLASPSNPAAVTVFAYGRAGDVPLSGRWFGGTKDVIVLVRNLRADPPLHCCYLDTPPNAPI